tara:strand:- start:6539 stop:6718 length:180 start_codon:yes stop_codon:yes gene_type:complete
MKSKGLGDTIKKLTSAAGLKQCGGCKKRQKTLNTLIPYSFNVSNLIKGVKKYGKIRKEK